MYDQIEDIITSGMGIYYFAILGDWNAVVGEERIGRVVGSYSLGQ